MTALRILLVAMFLTLLVFTVTAISHQGWNLMYFFFEDIIKMGWPGQFNLDFMFLLALSGLWVAWRHNFSGAGLALGLLAFFGGASFQTVYLFVASLQAKGDVRVVLLGKSRAGS